MKKAIFLLVFVLFLSCAKKQSKKVLIPEGKLISTKITSLAIRANLINETDQQEIAIYLPPSYYKTGKKYPVVYFLPGYMDSVQYWFSGQYQGLKLHKSMDKLIADGKVKEMIIVVVNGKNRLLGSFYVNSPVTGNWEDFVVKEAVNYIDSTYRTIKNSRSRAICGHSMGGFGAINAAMKHPDVFGLVYALSPGLYEKNGQKDNMIFVKDNEYRRDNFIKKETEYLKMGPSKARVALLRELSRIPWITKYEYGYGMAFSPRKDRAPYMFYPYKKRNGKIILDEPVWNKWSDGFGGLDQKIVKYANNLKKLSSIAFEVGNLDSYKWIVKGCHYLSSVLKKNNIKHSFFRFDGGHENLVRNRIEDYMLPFLSKELNYDQL